MAELTLNTDYIPVILYVGDDGGVGNKYSSEEYDFFSVTVNTGFFQNGHLGYGAVVSATCSVSMQDVPDIQIGARITLYFDLGEPDGLLEEIGDFYIENEPTRQDGVVDFTAMGEIASILESAYLEYRGEEWNDKYVQSYRSLADEIYRVSSIPIVFDDNDSEYLDLEEVVLPLRRVGNTPSLYVRESCRDIVSLMAFLLGANAVEIGGEIRITTVKSPTGTSADYFTQDSYSDLVMGTENYAPMPINLLYQPVSKPYKTPLPIYLYKNGDKETRLLSASIPDLGPCRVYALDIECDIAGPSMIDKGWHGRPAAQKSFSVEFVGYSKDIRPGAIIAIRDENGVPHNVICDQVTYNWDGGISMSVSSNFDATLTQTPVAEAAAVSLESEIMTTAVSSTTGMYNKDVLYSSSSAKDAGVNNAITSLEQIDTDLSEESENAVQNKAIAIPIHDILGSNNGNAQAQVRENGNIIIAGKNNAFQANMANMVGNAIIGGNGNIVRATGGKANYNLVSGASNTVWGAEIDDSIIGGNGNNVGNAHSSIIHGSGNSISATGSRDFSQSILFGSSNTITDSNVPFSLIGGSSNSFDGASIIESVVVGYKNIFKGKADLNYSLVTGNSNEADWLLNGSILSGSQNIAKSAVNESIIGGGSNTLNGNFEYSLLQGNENTTANVYSSIIGGFHNKITKQSTHDIICGSLNTIADSDESIISGSNNSVNNTSVMSIISGSGNTVQNAYESIISGLNNSTRQYSATSSLIMGMSNVLGANLQNAIIMGDHLTYPSTKSSQYSSNMCCALFGRYNADFDPNVYAIVLGGNAQGSTKPNNAFSVTWDGRIFLNDRELYVARDVTSECTIEMTENVLTVTVPIDDFGNSDYACASIVGSIAFEDGTSMLIRANAKFNSVMGDTDSYAFLDGASIGEYQSHYDGSVSVKSVGTDEFNAVITFDMGEAYTLKESGHFIIRGAGNPLNFLMKNWQIPIDELWEKTRELDAKDLEHDEAISALQAENAAQGEAISALQTENATQEEAITALREELGLIPDDIPENWNKYKSEVDDMYFYLGDMRKIQDMTDDLSRIDKDIIAYKDTVKQYETLTYKDFWDNMGTWDSLHTFEFELPKVDYLDVPESQTDLVSVTVSVRMSAENSLPQTSVLASEYYRETEESFTNGLFTVKTQMTEGKAVTTIEKSGDYDIHSVSLLYNFK